MAEFGWLPGCRALGGARPHEPEAWRTGLSPAASRLVERAYADTAGLTLTDYHVHLVGAGTGGTGAWLNPRLLTWRHPAHHFKARVFMSAAGVTDLTRCDQQYAERLVRLARSLPGRAKLQLLALDRAYRPDGTPDLDATEFYVPNEYVAQLAAAHPDLFVPVMSVHPYRPDAIAELERWAAPGRRYVKWLPNGQGIDPAAARCDSFYAAMQRLGLVLLTHGGEERAVAAGDRQALGNPLRLRRPLEHGVPVIVAHCASLGDNEDLDRPGTRAANFELFLRLLDDARYRGRLFGDLSASTQVNRTPGPLVELLRRPELHGRLVNGSDYPLPAINCVIWTRRLARCGLIAAADRAPLNEIYRHHPLLFDYVLKRLVRDPASGARFPAAIFGRHPELPA